MISRTPRFLSRVAQASASLKWYLRQHMAAMPMLMQGAELQSNQTLKSNQTHLDLEPNQARSVFHRVRESNKNSCFAVSHMLLFFLCCNFGLIEAVYAKPFFLRNMDVGHHESWSEGRFLQVLVEGNMFLYESSLTSYLCCLYISFS